METSLDSANQRLTLRVPGDLLSTNAEIVRAQIFPALDDPALRDSGMNTVEIDLRRATMVDSVGLNLLVAIIRAAQKIGAKVRISAANDNVIRTFQFTRLDQHAEIREEPLRA